MNMRRRISIASTYAVREETRDVLQNSARYTHAFRVSKFSLSRVYSSPKYFEKATWSESLVLNAASFDDNSQTDCSLENASVVEK